jgi:hypothetical protein
MTEQIIWSDLFLILGWIGLWQTAIANLKLSFYKKLLLFFTLFAIGIIIKNNKLEFRKL